MQFESQPGIFSPDGRLIQVEYAQHASNQGSTAVIQAIDDKVVIVYEDRHINPLIISTPKIHLIDSDRNFYMIYSGFKPDSLLVTSKAIGICRGYKYNRSEDIPINILASRIAEFKQQFTVDHGTRPLGLRSVLFGLEKQSNGMKARIFIIETDGNISEYQRVAVGYRNEVCNDYLVKNDKEDSAFKALLEVVQKDYKKVKGFVLDRNGLIEISKEEIRKSMGNE